MIELVILFTHSNTRFVFFHLSLNYIWISLFIVCISLKNLIPRGCNASCITLIPKVVNPQGLGDYRPISLVGPLYNILSNVLANRLKKVFNGVIDHR